MPTYEYRCKKCGHQFETFQKMTDEPVKTCPECSGKVSRILFPVGVVFKGSGFHVNDYPNSRSSASSAKTEEAKAETKTETITETKTEAKPEPTAAEKN
jgi:putative FmdB family regulatory protein